MCFFITSIARSLFEEALQDSALEAVIRTWAADHEISTVEEIGNAAVFLLSDASTAFHGASITADRGMTALLGGMGTGK